MLHSWHQKNVVLGVAVSFFSLFASPKISFSQKADGDVDAVFILKGYTRMANNKAAEGVELELKKNGQTISKNVTPKNGKYYLEMDISTLNKKNDFVLYITKEGTIPKSISLNTFIAPEEYKANAFPRYLFDLEIKMIETTVKQIIVEKPSGRIQWDPEQHAFAFDQTYAKTREDDTEKILAEKKKREEEELARKAAAEEARLKAEAEAKRLADQKSREEADLILQKNLEAMKLQIRKKRTQDSLDSLAVASQKARISIQKFSKPVSPQDVDQNAFDGTGAYSINIAKKSLRKLQESKSREKAANLSAKYETNNTLTSLLNVVDEHDKIHK